MKMKNNQSTKHRLSAGDRHGCYIGKPPMFVRVKSGVPFVRMYRYEL